MTIPSITPNKFAMQTLSLFAASVFLLGCHGAATLLPSATACFPMQPALPGASEFIGLNFSSSPSKQGSTLLVQVPSTSPSSTTTTLIYFLKLKLKIYPLLQLQEQE